MRAILVCASWAALAFGGAVSLLHVVHNRLDGPWDAFNRSDGNVESH